MKDSTIKNNEIRPSRVNLRNLVGNLSSQISVNLINFDPLKIGKNSSRQNFSSKISDHNFRNSFLSFSSSTSSSINSSSESGVDLIVSVSDSVPQYILIDKPYLLRILVNILSNSFKFTKSGYVMIDLDFKYTTLSTSEKSAQNDGDHLKHNSKTNKHREGCDNDFNGLNELNKDLVITVQDTGIGIPEAFKKDMFKPFKQAYSDISKEHKGTGLGLSICKALVEKLNGTITVESVEGEGSTFVIKLPIQNQNLISQSNFFSESPRSLSPSGSSLSSTRSDTYETPLKICVGLSQEKTESKVVEIFKKFGHNSLGFYTDFNQNQERFQKEVFDLVITDLKSLQSSVELRSLVKYNQSNLKSPRAHAGTQSTKLTDQKSSCSIPELEPIVSFSELKQRDRDESLRRRRHPIYYLTCSNPWLQSEFETFKGATNVRRLRSLGIVPHLILRNFSNQNRGRDEMNEINMSVDDGAEEDNEEIDNCSRVSSGTSQVSSPITPKSFQFDNIEILSAATRPPRSRSVESMKTPGRVLGLKSPSPPQFQNNHYPYLCLVNQEEFPSSRSRERSENKVGRVSTIVEYPMKTNFLPISDEEQQVVNEVQEEQEAEEEEEAERIRRINKVRNPKRILVVDDNELNLRLMRFNLKHLGYQKIYLAKDGFKALEMIDESRFDLILMDCEMPGISGLEVTEIIRSKIDNPNSKVPILAITANSVKPECNKVPDRFSRFRNIIPTGTIQEGVEEESYNEGGIEFNVDVKDSDFFEENKGDDDLSYKFGKLNEYLVKPVKINGKMANFLKKYCCL
ncbi:expressed protein [Phakopsora pachyrhizi]|uniref:histidine kinase n=1 Tax=Phakopsora pachyrhizi TaxID=170000 RepID=A0AAV0ARD7_PHAPC|nr:expressed protein [Phakopsora pachyrhizi]